MLNALRLGWLALAAWTLQAVLWLLDIHDHGPPTWVARAFAALALGLSLAVLTARGRRLYLQDRSQSLLFLTLLALALTLGLAGLGHEVGQGYYTDEGHYLHHARDINDGKLFTRSFIYPHLTYYLGGFALWLAELFPQAVAWLAGTVYGVYNPAAISWLVLRLMTALLGSLTVVPVFFLAWRVGGPSAASKRWAAVLSSALVMFSVHYQEGFQVNISDVPSAFFATVCVFFVGRLADRESAPGYILAGMASGLAAAAKYPAGVVAVSIVAIWLLHRVRRPTADEGRRWNWGLVWAGLASLGVFLVCNPSFLVHPDAAWSGPRGIFFGLNQYGKGGWVGVMPESNAVYYAERLVESFHWPALLLAAVGAFGLAARTRWRLLELAPFPVFFLTLICAMNMVVLRNLFPVLPTLAVFVGTAVSGLMAVFTSWPKVHRRLALATVTALALAWPAAATLRQTGSLIAPSTRDVMAAWVRDHVPIGAGILKESYTPHFNPREYRTIERRFAYRIHQERYDEDRFDFVLLAGSAYWRWLRPENQHKPWGAWYREIFATRELAAQVDPGPWRRGPQLRLYRLRDPTAAPVPLALKAEDAFATHPSMAAGQDLRFTNPGRTAVFTATLEPGRFQVEVQGRLKGPGQLRPRLLDGEILGEASLTSEGAEIQVPRRAKVFLALELPRGSIVRRIRLSPTQVRDNMP